MDMLMCMVTPSVDILSYSGKLATSLADEYFKMGTFFPIWRKRLCEIYLDDYRILNVFSLIPEMWYIDNQVKENKS